MSNIPPFADGYYLPPGEYECSFQDIEERFLETQRRIDVWKLFKNFLERLEFLGIIPNVLLIDGSFVTGRKEPGDVDVCMLIPPEKVKLAYDNLDNEEDRECLLYILHPDSQGALRLATGVHPLVVPDENGLKLWSDFFRTGGAQFGRQEGLKPPDVVRDPEWVKIPNEKGILKVVM